MGESEIRNAEATLLRVIVSALANAEERTPQYGLPTLAEVNVSIGEALLAAGYAPLDFWEARRQEQIRRANA